MRVALKPCAGCGRATRSPGTPAESAPGTITRANADMCHRCATRAAGTRGAGGKNFHVNGTEPEAVFVPVKTELPLAVYKRYRAAAEAKGVDVGVLLAHMAVASLVKRQPKRSSPKPLDATAAEEIRRLNGEGWSDNRIAQHLGFAQSSVSRKRGQMGLLPPKPRIGGRKAAS